MYATQHCQRDVFQSHVTVQCFGAMDYMSESPSRLIKISNPMNPSIPRHKVSGKESPVRIFQKDWMEAFTFISFRQFLVFCILVETIFIFLTVRSSASPARSVALICLGLSSWFFFEYFLHRFVFHFASDRKAIQKLVYIFHGNHHIQPNHPYRTLMPIIVTLPVGMMIFGGLFYALGLDLASAFFTGFFTGYVLYDTIHYATHNFSMKTFPFSLWKRHHLLHHYRAEEHNYSISFPWLDTLFCTKYRKGK